MPIRIALKSEVPALSEPAVIRVYDNEKLVAEVLAQIENKPGADGGMYPCVTLRPVTWAAEVVS